MKTHQKFYRKSLLLRLFRVCPKFTFRILDDAQRAVIYELAAERVSKDRLCEVQWYLANGKHRSFDATLVAQRLPCPASRKPCREVILNQPKIEANIGEVCRGMKECIAEADAKE